MTSIFGLEFGWESAISALSIYAGLRLFYALFKINWPEYYFSINDKNSLFVRHSFARFMLFRMLPPFFIILFFLTIFLREYSLGSVMFVSICAVTIYGLTSDGKALFRLFKMSKDVKIFFNKPAQIFFHIFVLGLLVVIGVVCAFFSKTQVALAIFPSYRSIVDNLWSAMIGFFLATLIKEKLSGNCISEDHVIKKSKNEISPEIFSLIDELSAKSDANPNLVKAIAVAENLQRPKWFRNIERIISGFGVHGTYGLMQVRSDGYLNDEESIRVAVDTYFSNTKDMSEEQIRETILRYNRSSAYQDIVLKVMNLFFPGK